MFLLDKQGVYRSSLLDPHKVVHGFSTRFASDWPGDYTQLKQIHSDSVIVADAPQGSLGEGDALVTREAGRLIGIRTADCVPILIFDPVKGAVAAVHAGWRGTVAKIVTKAVAKMTEQYGTFSAHAIAAIGPCIGPCCFEVGPEVGEQFRPLLPHRQDYRTVDLAEANRRLLVEAGLSPGRIDTSGLCTVCRAAEFYSWRRDREQAGRMVAAIGIAAEK